MASDLQEVKEAVRARTDLVELVGSYLALKRAGKNFTGLCPFHTDHKPSFHVSPSLQIYKCYACGEGGDVFRFVQKIENLEFVEALEFLARRAGITFERHALDTNARSNREQMREINRAALQFFKDRLAVSGDARDYLARRAVLRPTQDVWDIGYAPPEWDALCQLLQRRGHSLELAASLGLIKLRNGGDGYYDAYRNRIIFPIHDLSGQVAGFGGRALDPDQPAKYINSDNSPLFDKSSILYGLAFARKKFAEGVSPVLVEGYLDVVAAHQAGFTQCVASLGTSLTEQHARLLARYSTRALFCYDADNAGVKAALRGAEIWESMGLEGGEAQIVVLPRGEDPDSLLRNADASAFQKALDAAMGRVDYQLDRIQGAHDLNTAAGKEAALAESIPVLASIPLLSTRSRYADRLAALHPIAGRYGLERAIEQILADAETLARTRRPARPGQYGYAQVEAQNRQELQNQPPAQTFATQAPARTGPEKAEQQLLRALLSGDWRMRLLEQLTPAMMPTAEGTALLQCIARTPAQEDGSVLLQDLRLQVERFCRQDENEQTVEREKLEKISARMEELMQDSPYYVANEALTDTAVQDCIVRLNRYWAEQERLRLSELLNKTTDAEELRSLLQQYQLHMRALRGNN